MKRPTDPPSDKNLIFVRPPVYAEAWPRSTRRSTNSFARRGRPRRGITPTRLPLIRLRRVRRSLINLPGLVSCTRAGAGHRNRSVSVRSSHAQQRAGRSFDQLRHAGAAVLHARRLPRSAQPVDHLIVTAGATFAVHDLAGSRREPITWTCDGHLTQAGVDTEALEAALVAGVAVIAAATADILGAGWRTWVVPVLAMAGPWSQAPMLTATGVMAGTPDGLRRWMIQAFIPTLDALDVATMANGVSRSCPRACA